MSKCLEHKAKDRIAVPVLARSQTLCSPFSSPSHTHSLPQKPHGAQAVSSPRSRWTTSSTWPNGRPRVNSSAQQLMSTSASAVGPT